MTNLQTISPKRAAELIKDGAILVDIREADEHARERIPGARHRALSKIARETVAHPGERAVIFHCRSGMRTQANAPTLAEAAPCEAFLLEGGLEAWKKAGLPVALDKKQPIDIVRQVQIGAGSLVLIGAILALTVDPAFVLLSAFVGAGLVFAGVTGFCTMAKVLARMPWNRRASSGGGTQAQAGTQAGTQA